MSIGDMEKITGYAFGAKAEDMELKNRLQGKRYELLRSLEDDGEPAESESELRAQLEQVDRLLAAELEMFDDDERHRAHQLLGD